MHNKKQPDYCTGPMADTISVICSNKLCLRDYTDGLFSLRGTFI